MLVARRQTNLVSSSIALQGKLGVGCRARRRGARRDVFGALEGGDSSGVAGMVP